MYGQAGQYISGFLSGACLAGLMGFHCASFAALKVQDVWPEGGKVSKFLSPLEPQDLSSETVSPDMKGLQIDVYGLPPEFLDSTQQVNAVMEAAIGHLNTSTILHRITHHFQPLGLSSLWLLSASHASIRTSPAEGFAAIDVLASGSSDLELIATVLQELLSEVNNDVVVQFALTERGQGRNPRPVNDLAVQLSSMQQEKSAFHRGKSSFQSIEVWDVKGDSWVDGPHETLDRRLYLDGVLQLATQDEALYHEAMVHPSMLAHAGPQKVVIMGGGNGGALRNVLMHRSVRSVRLLEIDEQVVEVSKRAFPSFTTAFFDPRAKVFIADAFQWIAEESRLSPHSVDAVFFDLLDISVPSPLLDMLFTEGKLTDFISQTHDILHMDGFAVFQLGAQRIEVGGCMSLEGSDTACKGTLRQRTIVEDLKTRFKSVFVYSQYVPSFLGNRLFAVASDSDGLAQRWQQPASKVDRDISERLFQHESLGWFGGASMQKLRVEPGIEPRDVVRRFEPSAERPQQQACPGLVPARNNSEYPGYVIPYMLAKSKQGLGIGVYTLRPIKRGEVVWRFHNESFREVTPNNWRQIVESQPFAKENGVKAFLEHDWINEFMVPADDGSGVTIKMFMELDDARFDNHGYTPSRNKAFVELADSEGASEAPQDHEYGRVIIATRDIEACEELLEDYQSSFHSLEQDQTDHRVDWWSDILASYGLTNGLDFSPASSDFPEWAWLGGPSNID